MLLILVAFTQVIIPLLKGTLVFPFFRKARKKEHEIVSIEEERDEVRLDQEIARKRDKLDQEKKKGGLSKDN